MATITNVDPLRSRKTGGISVTVTGTDFETTDLSDDFSGAAFYSDISSGGTINQAGKLTLSVSTTPGEMAGVRTNHSFGDAFKVGIAFDNNAYAYPAVNDATIMALQAVNETDSTTYFSVGLRYKDGLGYYINTVASISGVIELDHRKSVNPAYIEEIRIIRAESKLISYVKMLSNEIEVSEYYGFGSYDSRIEILIENSPLSIAEDFSMDVTAYLVDTHVSLAHNPLSISSVTDTEIIGITNPSDAISGSIILATPDGNTATYAEAFAYTEAVGLDRETKNFDIAISVYGYQVSPTRYELFTSGGGFTWDKDYWIDPDEENKNLFVPSLWDSTTSNISDTFFQSGYTHGDAVEMQGIYKFKVNDDEKWHAKLKHGGYYIKNVPYYLYGSESIPLQLSEEVTDDGRSKQVLQYLPKPGIPIVASTLKVDKVTGLIIDAERFKKRGRFTGRIQNGIELDTSVVSNIDSLQKEFTVTYNSNNQYTNWRIPISSGLSSKASVTLGNITFTTKEYTSNFNGYSIEILDGVSGGHEYIEKDDKEIKIYIEDGISITQSVVDIFNDIFSSPLGAEETKIVCLDGSGLGGTYFLLNSPTINYYFWFNTGSDTDPAISGRTGIEVQISASSAAWQVAALLQAEINTTLDFSTSLNNEIVTTTCLEKGIVNDASSGNTGFEIEVLVQGSKDVLEAINNSPAYSEITEITCPDGSGLLGKYFRIYSPTTAYYVWYTDGASVDPDPDAGGSIGIPVTISVAETDVGVAELTKDEIIILPDFSAITRSEVVVIANESIGASQDAVDGDAGVTTDITQQGTDNTVEEADGPKSLYTTYSFSLPEVPLQGYSVDFSRKDIFVNKKFIADEYGSGVYNNFYYGEGVSGNNDYAINYLTGEVIINLDQDYLDLGYVSFTYDYPAVIEFNNNYLEDYGLSITAPTINDIGQLDDIAESSGEPSQFYHVSEFPILDYSTENYLDQNNFRLFIYDTANNLFDSDWTRVASLDDYGPTDKVYHLIPDKGLITFGDGINGAVPPKYQKIVAGYKRTVRIEYEPVSSSDYWFGKNIDLNLSKNDLSSGFLFLSRKDLVPFQIQLQFSTNEITALEFAELKAVVLDVDGEKISGVDVEFELINVETSGLESTSATTNFAGEARTIYLPSGSVNDLGTFAHLFTGGIDSSTPGDFIEGRYFSSSAVLQNNMLVLEENVYGDAEDIYIFKILDDGDGFTPYDNQTRTGGTYQVLFKYNTTTGLNELVRPNAISGRVLIFDESLPQPIDSNGLNYEPDLRGFIVIGKKLVQAKASVQAGTDFIDSDIASLSVEYSPIQKGEWTLPILPTTFTSSEINRAAYITINPPKNEMIFTQSGDTDTIVLEHDGVLGYTINITVNGKEFGGWTFDSVASPDQLVWDYSAIKNNDNIVITYAYEIS